MSIDLARKVAGALDVRSETKIRSIDQALSAYARLTTPSPVVPITGTIDTSQVVSGTFDDDRIAESNVTQHEAALSIDAGTQLVNTLADARVAESNVTQHEAALGIDYSQLTSVPTEFSPENHLTHGAWTPIDSSGAGLTFSAAGGVYTRHEDMIFARGYCTYPATADASNAVIGGLPYALVSGEPNRQGTLVYSSTSTAAFVVPVNAGTTFNVYQVSGGFVTNASLSTRTLYFSFFYRGTIP